MIQWVAVNDNVHAYSLSFSLFISLIDHLVAAVIISLDKLRLTTILNAFFEFNLKIEFRRLENQTKRKLIN